MKRSSFLKRMAFAALACAFLDVKAPEVGWEEGGANEVIRYLVSFNGEYWEVVGEVGPDGELIGTVPIPEDAEDGGPMTLRLQVEPYDGLG